MISDDRIKEICDLYYNDVYRYCFSYLKNVEDSKDVTQDTFEFLIEKADTLEDTNIKAWLYSVAFIKIKSFIKPKSKKANRIWYSDQSNLIISESKTYSIEDTISQYLYDEERIESEKQKILDSLTPKERELYNDAYVEKRKYSEIARNKGVSTPTVNVQTFRLRNKIKAIVKGVFEFCLTFL